MPQVPQDARRRISGDPLTNAPSTGSVPDLCLLWPRRLLDCCPEAALPAGYGLRPYGPEDAQELRALLEADGRCMGETVWKEYRARLLVDGLFLVFETATATLAASAGAIHHPCPGWYHFPFGGELANLVVHSGHRNKGLGRAMSALVLRRFLAAGYENIRVCGRADGLMAVRLYLKLGFVPFLYHRDVGPRWQKTCSELRWDYTPHRWPPTLP